MKRSIVFFLLFCLTTLLPADPVNADWINLTGAENARNIAEIYVEKDYVKIKLEVYIEDLIIFDELIPESFFPQAIPGRPGLEERRKIIADKVFQVITDKGEKLPVTIDLIEPRLRIERPSPFAGSINPYTRQRIPGRFGLVAQLTILHNGRQFVGDELLQFIHPRHGKAATGSHPGMRFAETRPVPLPVDDDIQRFLAALEMHDRATFQQLGRSHLAVPVIVPPPA